MLQLYRTMVLIRACEQRLVKSYQAGLIYGAKRCPIALLSETLAAAGVPAKELEEIDEHVARVVDEAHTQAEVEPWPNPVTLTQRVYTDWRGA